MCKLERFVFNYCPDYEGADVIILTNTMGIFALIFFWKTY